MSQYTHLMTYKGRDLEIYYTPNFGTDVKHGDFEIEIDEIYLDLNHATKNGKDIIEEFDDLDVFCEAICEDPDFYDKATEEQLDRADWMRDQMKDSR